MSEKRQNYFGETKWIKFDNHDDIIFQFLMGRI